LSPKNDSKTPKSANMQVNSLGQSQIAKAAPIGLALIASNYQYQIPDHIQLLNKKLMDVTFGDIHRLMIFLPPRHGKSWLLSHFFPAWYLGMFPDKRVILTAYEADFAATWGRRAKDILNEYGKSVFGIEVMTNPLPPTGGISKVMRVEWLLQVSEVLLWERC